MRPLAPRLPRLDLGLNTSDPPSSLIPGVLQTADNVTLTDGVLRSAPGYTRLSNSALFDDHAYKLDGQRQYWRGPIHSTGSLVALNGSAWTLEVFFRVDFWPKEILGSISAFGYIGFILNKVLTATFSAANDDYWAAITTADVGGSYEPGPRFTFKCSSGVSPVTITSDVELEIGADYHAAVTNDGTNINVYVAKTTGAFGTPVSQAFGTTVQDQAVDLIVGALMDTTVFTEEERVKNAFPGVIQEIRFWDVERSAAELAEYHDRQMTDAEVTAESDMIACYRMTGAGSNTYFQASEKGTAGSGSGEAPLLQLMPRSATWRVDGHALGDPFVGDSSIDLRGKTQGLVVHNGYLYRVQTPDEDGLLAFPDAFILTLRCSIRRLVTRATLFHYVQVADEDWTTNLLAEATAASTFNPSGSTGNLVIELLDTGGGTFQFRAVVYHDDGAGGTLHASSVETTVSGGLQVGTEYVVTVSVDNDAQAIKILDPETKATDASQAMTASEWVPSTANDPPGANAKYAMSIGRAIKRSRQDILNPSDPNGVIVEYDFARSFDGEIRQVGIVTLDSPATGIPAVVSLLAHGYSHDEIPIRGEVGPSGLAFQSFWPMNEGKGSVLEDLGLQGNSIVFREDPGHVWGKSVVETNEKSKVRGLFDHRYRSPTGEVKKAIAVAGGSVYEIDRTTGAATHLADGFRNDDQNLVSAAKHLDSMVLACGSKAGNFHLWKDNLYRLAIEPPTGFIPFGLVDQANKDAAVLFTGDYRYGFTFYSSLTGKRSALGSQVVARIRSKYANVAFGDRAEINQTQPRTGYSVNKAPYDLSSMTGNAYIRVAAWYGEKENNDVSGTDPTWWQEDPENTSGSGTEFEAKYRRYKFLVGGTAHSLIEDDENVEVEECVAVMKSRSVLIDAEEGENDTWRITGAFVGARGFLEIKNGGAEDLTEDGTGAFDFEVPASPGYLLFEGTGDSSHGLTLPVSSDPQVTHLEVWRSTLDGTQLRLIARLPNGTQGFVDYLADADNVGEILDVTTDSPPTVEFVANHAGRMLFIKDPLAPQRLYFSQVSQPWSVPAQNVVDFLDGSTLGITGVGMTEGAVFLFKEETTFILTQPTTEFVPFDVVTRTRDIGCVSPFGIVNVDSTTYYPAERGIYGFDGSFPRYLSGYIDQTWEAVPPEHRAKIVAVHDRRNDQILWLYPSGDTVDDAGTVVNDSCLVWNYTIGGDPLGQALGWTKLTNVPIVYATIIPDEDETDNVWFVDAMGFLYKWGTGTNYGVGSLTNRNPSGSAGTFSTTQVTITRATLANVPEGYLGFMLTVVDASDTTGLTRATRLVVADTKASPSVVTLDHALPFTPVVGDTYILGSIEAVARSGEMDFGAPATEKSWKETHFRQTLQSTAAVVELLYHGQGGLSNQADEQSKTFQNDEEIDNLIATTCRGRRLSVGFRALGADKPFVIRDVTLLSDPSGRGSFKTP